MPTFGDAKKALAQYAGRGGLCPDDPEVHAFTYRALQHVLYSGANGAERQFCFHAVDGCFTVPHELEVPLKVKIGGEVGTVWDRFFDYRPTIMDESCIPAARGLIEDPNYYATVYPMPVTGMRVGVVATATEADEAHIIVQGRDPTGAVVYTDHEGEKLAGEYLRLKKGELRYTQVTFGFVDAVNKSPTNGYVMLYGYNPDTKVKKFISQYSPVEEVPQYRRFRLTTPCKGVHVVYVLGRIRLKPNYLDNDLIPFDNYLALDQAGKELHATKTDNAQAQQAAAQTLQRAISNENNYKQINNGKAIEVFLPTSNASIRRLYPSGVYRRVR